MFLAIFDECSLRSLPLDLAVYIYFNRISSLHSITSSINSRPCRCLPINLLHRSLCCSLSLCFQFSQKPTQSASMPYCVRPTSLNDIRAYAVILCKGDPQLTPLIPCLRAIRQHKLRRLLLFLLMRFRHTPDTSHMASLVPKHSCAINRQISPLLWLFVE